MDRRDIVVIGGSAGGVEALMQICAGLPVDLPAALFVVQHISPTSKSVLPDLLSKAGPLPAKHPVDGEPIQFGTIVVAPPDFHLLLQDGRVLLRRGPQENRTRPAIDPLFRSAAVAYGPRVVGVVLTGLLDDGAAGLQAIKRCGGTCVVQDPDDAQWPDMPRRALERDNVDHVATLAEMPALLDRLSREPAGPKLPVPRSLEIEGRIAAQELGTAEVPTLGQPSALSCPVCGGVLNEVLEEGNARFRCQTGHAFTSEGLVVAQGEALERALESAARTHRDRLTLCRRMEEQAVARVQPHSAARWRAAAEEAGSAAAAITAAIDALRRPPVR
jgi:two-component system, chemotaxis family, protein-glutamate methylesterase/glutaminase